MASKNQISDIFELTYLSKLKHLELESNYLSDEESFDFLNMLDSIEYINIANNKLINDYDTEKINEIFGMRKIERTKLDLSLFNVERIEDLPRDKLIKLEGKFIEFYLKSNNSKIKLCKKYFLKSFS